MAGQPEEGLNWLDEAAQLVEQHPGALGRSRNASAAGNAIAVYQQARRSGG